MVLDTSALIAILEEEALAPRLEVAMAGAPRLFLSASSLVEASIVVTWRRQEEGERRLDRLLDALGVEIVSVTPAHAHLARSAFRRFGKGRHPASLNFGDCFSYALAQALDEPLLFVGQDFSRTDVKVAAY